MGGRLTRSGCEFKPAPCNCRTRPAIPHATFPPRGFAHLRSCRDSSARVRLRTLFDGWLVTDYVETASPPDISESPASTGRGAARLVRTLRRAPTRFEHRLVHQPVIRR